jgi:hypothetical protein
MLRKTLAALALALIAFAGFAEGTQENPGAFAFSAGLNLGTDVIAAVDGTTETWTKLAFQPDLAFGKIGVGIDLTVHFKLYPTNDQAIEFYPGDWVPDYNGNGKNFFDLYLPKILYVRYGLKGADPFFVKLGSMNDLSLGNGFIMDDYSNMNFMPATRIFGLDIGLDGQLFNFPYVGLELVTGNLAKLDLVGGRLFARPLIGTEIPIVKNMQVGATVVADNVPDAYAATAHDAKPLAVYGMDVVVPILGGKVFPLAAFSEMAFEPNKSMGAMLGAGGRLFGFITYGAQLRFLQDGFIPSYFDTGYDIYRAAKFDYMQDSTGGSFKAGWYATLGFSLLDDKIALSARMDGPFTAVPGVATSYQGDYPHAKAVLKLAEGLLGGFYFDARYEKYYIGKVAGFFSDLVDPTDAIVGLDINYKTGASVLTLAYNAKWDPSLNSGSGKWVVTSSITASMKF